MDLSAFTQIDEALLLYSFSDPKAELIRHNENMTFQVTDNGRKTVLRIHRPAEGFSLGIFHAQNRQRELIQNELEILSMLKTGGGLPVQSPVRSKLGDLVPLLLSGTPVSMLEWIDGKTLDAAVVTPDTLKAIGEMTANLHGFFAQNKEQCKRYARYNYDQTILPAIAEKIHLAKEGGFIHPQQKRIILSALDEMELRLNELDCLYEKIIVHADLSKSNMVLGSNGGISPIDFSLCGFSHFYMDIGGLFGHIDRAEDRGFILDGYRNGCDCQIDPYFIEPYFALNVILFIACQFERSANWDWFNGAMERWCKDIFVPFSKKTGFLLA